ncbi:MAG TPA: hypothetical protein VGR92_15505 [Steroidobacteraceae bacterium]|nr:hypothetical protein [Steroidobacteraceae bacterium]
MSKNTHFRWYRIANLIAISWLLSSCRTASAQVSIGLSRFTATHANSLVKGLSSLGMGLAFSPDTADFAGLASGPGIHKPFLVSRGSDA